jgi:hypothetical protein
MARVSFSTTSAFSARSAVNGSVLCPCRMIKGGADRVVSQLFRDCLWHLEAHVFLHEIAHLVIDGQKTTICSGLLWPIKK